MRVVIKINGRDAIPVRALPLLAEWRTMYPEKIAGALGRVTDDGRPPLPLFGNLHDMNAFYAEDGVIHPMAEHHWRDHIYRNLKALSDTIKHAEITHETGHAEWRVKALGVLPNDAFVWKDEYELIYDLTYRVGSRTKQPGDAHNPPLLSGGKPPVALNFTPPVPDDMQPLLQAALNAIGRAISTGSTTQIVEHVPLSLSAKPASDDTDWAMLATRQQLIDAFRSYTGMSVAWFDNLTDAPALGAARRIRGVGGNHPTEPMFCPYEVMTWLISPKRRKGKKVPDDTAWRMLEEHFPRVHARYSVGDTRTD